LPRRLKLTPATTWRGASRDNIIMAVEASLRRLNTDRIDLYQLHTPDPNTAIDETLCALDDLVRSGKVRFIGASNLDSEQVETAQLVARELRTHRFISSQDEYSLLERAAERRLIPTLKRFGLGLIPYAPLANGILTGKYSLAATLPPGARLTKVAPLAEHYLTERNLMIAERLQRFAMERDHSLLELSFSWLAAQPVVASIIAGASTGEQVRQNAAAADWSLTQGENDEVEAILRAGHVTHFSRTDDPKTSD
jgi:aryl-alcohol dehydrogenase-like predicted oxidoreductase